MRGFLEGIDEEHAPEVDQCDNEAGEKAPRRFLPLSVDAERNADEGKGETGEGQGATLVQLHVEFLVEIRRSIRIMELFGDAGIGEFVHLGAAFIGVGPVDVPGFGLSSHAEFDGAVVLVGFEVPSVEGENELFLLHIDTQVYFSGMHVGCGAVIALGIGELVEVESAEFFTVTFFDVDFLARKFCLDDARIKEDLGIPRGGLVGQGAPGGDGNGGDRADDVIREAGEEDAEDEDRGGDAGQAHASHAEADELMVRGKASKAEQDGSEESPREGERQGEGNDVEDEFGEEAERGSLFDQIRSDLFHDLAHDQNDGEQTDGENRPEKDLPADIAVRDTHLGADYALDGLPTSRVMGE